MKNQDLIAKIVKTVGNPASEDNNVNVLIRPEDITFSLSSNVTSARNMFHGRITKLTQLGPLVRLEVDCGFSLLGLLTRSSVSDLELEVGKEIHASFKVTATHVIRRLV